MQCTGEAPFEPLRAAAEAIAPQLGIEREFGELERMIAKALPSGARSPWHFGRISWDLDQWAYDRSLIDNGDSAGN